MTVVGATLPVGAVRCVLGEGPRWLGEYLVFVDILEGALYRSDPLGGHGGVSSSGSEWSEPRLVFRVPETLGAVAPRADGGFIAAMGAGIALLDELGGGEAGVRWLAKPEADSATAMRMNDGAADPHGNFWAGSMAFENTPGAGSLYRVRPSGAVERVLDGLTIPNGPAFTPSGDAMYLADSARGEVYRFPLTPNGELGERELFLAVGERSGSPDGMCVDSEGNLWVAFWGAGEVRQYTPDGALLLRVPVAASHVTAPCLGGKDRRTLFIASAAFDAPRGDGAPGALFTTRVAVPGVTASEFLWAGEISGG